jgi:hypothetical protein
MWKGNRKREIRKGSSEDEYDESILYSCMEMS